MSPESPGYQGLQVTRLPSYPGSRVLGLGSWVSGIQVTPVTLVTQGLRVLDLMSPDSQTLYLGSPDYPGYQGLWSRISRLPGYQGLRV